MSESDQERQAGEGTDEVVTDRSAAQLQQQIIPISAPHLDSIFIDSGNDDISELERSDAEGGNVQEEDDGGQVQLNLIRSYPSSIERYLSDEITEVSDVVQADGDIVVVDLLGLYSGGDGTANNTSGQGGDTLNHTFDLGHPSIDVEPAPSDDDNSNQQSAALEMNHEHGHYLEAHEQSNELQVFAIDGNDRVIAGSETPDASDGGSTVVKTILDQVVLVVTTGQTKMSGATISLNTDDRDSFLEEANFDMHSDDAGGSDFGAPHDDDGNRIFKDGSTVNVEVVDGQPNEPQDVFITPHEKNKCLCIAMSDCCDEQVTGSAVALHPEYPLNYNNYKVCRMVTPNLKECLILETGENVTCEKTTEGWGISSTVDTPSKDAIVVNAVNDDDDDDHTQAVPQEEDIILVPTPVSSRFPRSDSESSDYTLSPSGRKIFKINNKTRMGSPVFENLCLNTCDSTKTVTCVEIQVDDKDHANDLAKGDGIPTSERKHAADVTVSTNKAPSLNPNCNDVGEATLVSKKDIIITNEEQELESISTYYDITTPDKYQSPRKPLKKCKVEIDDKSIADDAMSSRHRVNPAGSSMSEEPPVRGSKMNSAPVVNKIPNVSIPDRPRSTGQLPERPRSAGQSATSPEDFRFAKQVVLAGVNHSHKQPGPTDIHALPHVAAKERYPRLNIQQRQNIKLHSPRSMADNEVSPARSIDAMRSGSSSIIRSVESSTNHSYHEPIDMSVLYRAERWLGDGGRERSTDSDTTLKRNQSSSSSTPLPGGQRDPINIASLSISTASGSTTSTGGHIPTVRTLQDQQSSWTQMFSTLEKQHQSELLVQYEEHQQNIARITQQMQDDLQRQQDSFRERLEARREQMVHDTSFAGSYVPLTDDRRHINRVDLQNDVTDGGISFLSQIENDVARDPPGYDNPIYSTDNQADYHRNHVTSNILDEFSERPKEFTMTTHFPGRDAARRSLENSFNEITPPMTPISGVLPRQPVAFVSRSTPMLPSQHTSSVLMSQHVASSQSQADSLYAHGQSRDLQYHNDALSLSLREKHAQHLSDLRRYYQQELQDLQSTITSPGKSTFSPYRQVMEENLHLQGHLEEAQIESNKMRSHVRELENKVSSLQVRLDDVLERYGQSQELVSRQQTCLEDLRVQYQGGQMQTRELEAENMKFNTLLKDALQTQSQQTDYVKRQEMALQKLLDKYEALEEEQHATKGSLNDIEGKLYDARTEAVDFKRVISRLELENKRLSLENDNMHHKGLVSNLSSSRLGMLSPVRDILRDIESPREIASHNVPTTTTTMVNGRENRSAGFLNISSDSTGSSEARTPPRKTRSHQEIDESIQRSPLMQAEHEYQNLRKAVKQSLSSPSMQPYPRPTRNGDLHVDLDVGVQNNSRNVVPKSRKSSSHRSLSKDNLNRSRNSSETGYSPDQVQIIDCLSATRNSSLQKAKNDISSSQMMSKNIDSSPRRFDIIFTDNSPAAGGKKRPKMKPRLKDTNETQQSYTNGHRRKDDSRVVEDVEMTLSRIRNGQVSAPTNTYASTKSKRASETGNSLKSRNLEERVRDRLTTMQGLEHHYDDLQAEKRELESALSKVPLSGSIAINARKNKEELENRLERLEQELGSVRMSLKRHHILKTSAS